MNQVSTVEKKTSLTTEFRDQWTRQEQELTSALPPHIPVERFMRVVMTAVSASPDLLAADRRSLFESSMKAAQDGLLPDGRDGALVIYNTKIKEDGKDVWIKKVQWMPMVGGILKKIRNSGELLTISAYVAYDKDEFEYTLGDEESIIHRPCLEEDRGRPRLVYAVAKTKDGGVYREIMTLKEVEKVRNVSKAKDSGPWKDWWDEMAKKTVIRRLAKRLPMSSDLDDLIRRDDDLYDFQGKRADMEDMRKQLQAPNVLDRLREAREAVPAVEDRREGFDQSFVRSETQGALTGQIIEPDNQSDASPSSEVDASSPDASIQAGDVPPSSPASSIPMTDEVRTHLIDFARKASKTAGDEDLSKESKSEAIETMIANYREAVPESEWGKLSTIKISMQAVLAGKRTVDQARRFMAGDLLECAVEELGG